MIYTFAKNRVWLLHSLAHREMSCLRLESEHQNNAILEAEWQQLLFFSLLLDTTLLELGILDFIIILSSHDTENNMGTSWILNLLAPSFWV